MALPEQYLKKTPEEQRVLTNAAMKAYLHADPDKREEAARAVLTQETPSPQKDEQAKVL